MNPGLSWRPASAASEFPFSFEVFDICIWCPKQRTHRPDLPVVGQHQFQSIESCARLTILPTLMVDTRADCSTTTVTSDAFHRMDNRLHTLQITRMSIAPQDETPLPVHSQANLCGIQPDYSNSGGLRFLHQDKQA